MKTPVLEQALNRLGRRVAEGHGPTWILSYLLLAAFYLLTATSNYAETDDVFAFAYRAEHLPLNDISDPRLMLYHMLMRCLYLGLSFVFPDIPSLPIMRGVALLSAPLIILLLARLLVTQFSLRGSSAVLTVALLAVSYGFWRYAVEADVYIPATLLIMTTLNLLLTSGPKWTDRRLACATVIAAVTVLFYQPAVLAVFLSFPLLLLQRRRAPQLIMYCTAGGALVLAGYIAAFFYSQEAPLTAYSLTQFLAQRSQEFMVPPLSLAVFVKSVIKSGMALAHDLLSANWLFGIDAVAQLIQRLFPNNVIEEEIFAARSAGWMPWLSFFWVPALALVTMRLLWRAPAPATSRLWERPLQLCLWWLAINAAVIGRLNPAGIEAWLMVLVPLFVLLGVFLMDPLVGAGRTALLTLCLALYFGHNLSGGIAMMWDRDGDLDFVKGQWAIEEAGARDTIIVVDDAGLAEMLRYRSVAQVDLVRAVESPGMAQSLLSGEPPIRPVLTFGRNFKNQNVYDHIQRSAAAGGSVFLFDEFFSWDTEYRHLYRRQSAMEQQVLTQLRQATTAQERTEVGGVYRITAKERLAGDTGP